MFVKAEFSALILKKFMLISCFDRVTNVLICGKVDETPCPIYTCTYDMTGLSDNKEDLQILVNERG